jgi:Acetyl-CoA hydrolase/transferase C-terminal domain
VRIVSERRLGEVLAALPGIPRVVAGGNFGTPWRALAALDAAVADYRLFMLNAQTGVPDRNGVTLETPFVGPGMRGRMRLKYFPSRLSLVPVLQLGIGAVPDAVLAALGQRQGLKVWSEMFSDGVLSLDKAGALDPAHPVVASFAFGSTELYDWMHRNPSIRMLRTETTNDPAQIERRTHMVSVNSALEVDLFAEANASRVRGRIYSGFGGQTDFVVGAMHSPEGIAVIALPSWHPKADVSTVVPRLHGPVTSFQHSFIVSDQGTATI